MRIRDQDNSLKNENVILYVKKFLEMVRIRIWPQENSLSPSRQISTAKKLYVQVNKKKTKGFSGDNVSRLRSVLLEEHSISITVNKEQKLVFTEGLSRK